MHSVGRHISCYYYNRPWAKTAPLLLDLSQIYYLYLSRMRFRLTLLLALLALGCWSVVDRTYYIYMGLDISATSHEIQQAYLTKKSKIEALEDEEARTQKLKLLQEAYDVLSDADKRSTYDMLNKDLFRKDKVIANLKKLTDKGKRKGKTILMTLPVSVQDVYQGKTVQATFLKHMACEKCKGTGAQSPKFLNACARCGGNGFTLMEGVNPYGQRFVSENTCGACQGWGKTISKPCPVCGGRKVLPKMEQVKIKIPHGLPDGNILRIPNFGDESVTGAPSDLEVTVVQIPSEKWSRNGEDLIYTAQISLKESIFGFSKELTHLSGEKIPIERSEVTTRQTSITIPNEGIVNPKTARQGNLIVKFKIVMPEFSDEQLDQWEEFFKVYNI